jgi:hypothetical protein
MKTNKKTIEEVKAVCEGILNHPAFNQTKAAYAAGKYLQQNKAVIDEISGQREDFSNKHQAVAEDKTLLYEQTATGRLPKFTPESNGKFMDNIREMWKEEVEVKPYFCTDNSYKKLPIAWQITLEGHILEEAGFPEDEPKIEPSKNGKKVQAEA